MLGFVSHINGVGSSLVVVFVVCQGCGDAAESSSEVDGGRAPSDAVEMAEDGSRSVDASGPEAQGFAAVFGSSESGPAGDRVQWEAVRGLSLLSGGGVAVVGDLHGPVSSRAEVPHVEGADAFAVAYRPDGTVSWARGDGAPGSELPVDVATSPRGELWVVGSFTELAEFGPLVLRGGGRPWTFIVRLRADGTPVAAACVPCADSAITIPSEVRVDREGRPVIVGSYVSRDPVLVGPSDRPVASLPATGRDLLSTNGYVVVLDGDGEAVAALALVADVLQMRALATLDGGDVVVGGEIIAGTLELDTLGGRARIGEGGFVLRWSPTENAVRWALSIQGESGSGRVRGLAAAVDDVFVTGTFAGTLALAGAAPVSSAGERDLFVASLSADGEVRWVGRIGADGDDEGAEIAVSPDGERILIGGGFAGCLRASEGRAVASRGQRDLLVAAFDGQGTLRGLLHPAGGVADEDVYAVALDDRRAYAGAYLAGEGHYGVGDQVAVVRSESDSIDALTVAIPFEAMDLERLGSDCP